MKLQRRPQHVATVMLIAAVLLLTLYVVFRILTGGDTDGLIDASGAKLHTRELPRHQSASAAMSSVTVGN